MSTKLGTLTLDLIAKIGNFTGPIKDAEKQSKLSFENMRKHVNTYGTAILGIAASSVTALAGMALQTANQAAELEQFALRANTTTQEFQKMAVGAAAFGIEGDKLSDMMKDFNEKLGELTAIGAGGGVDFFEQIAMKTEGTSEAAQQLILDMQKLSGPEALQMYVDKLEEAGVTQQQMSFYLESMASDMTDLIPLLVNGGEGMRLYGDMAERAGIIMTDETIEAAKSLKDQVYMLDLQMQGAKNQLMQAVIPAFVDIAEAFFGGSEQGLQFTEVANGVAKTLKGVAATAIGAVTAIQLVGKALGGMAAIGGAIWSETDWYEMNPIGLAKAAYEARGEIAALTSEIKTDMHQTVMGAANRLDKMWNSGTSEQSKQLRGIRELNQNVGNTNAGLSELASKQNESEKATRKNTKAINEQNRALEDARRLIYEYGSEFNRIETDLSEEINRIMGSSLKAETKPKMIEDAKAIAEARKKLYAAELDYDLNQYQMTEREKLKAQLNIDKLSIDATKGLLDAERKLKKDALDTQSKIEQTAVRISQDKSLLETKRTWMTAGDYAREYYALVREEILNTASYSPEMKEALLQQAVSQQNFEQSDERDQAIGDYRDVMGYEESPLVKQFEVLDKMRELDLINEEKYQQDKLMLQTKYSASYMESMLGGFAALIDQNSSLYAGLFAAQKAFAVAQAMLNIPAAYSKAYDAVVGTPFVGPYIAPAVGAAAAALQVAQAASIKSVGLTGMAHDGINNIPEEGTWLLNKGERVLNPSQNKDLTNYLSQVQTGGQNRPIDNKLSVIMVKDEDEAKNYKYSKDFEDAVLYHMKRNRSKI
ncbi:hypothetical protein 2F2_27 [uncultured Caudovirales phage]|uniref:Uncharacterized protein n=1 Tax=uncultured Caudovirales phage TaxID=2100421 RepID=A0A2H4J326_9CAUD|nr:hypothetical protein 2F2_27 [uncultured Caudovirales phage]